MDATDTHRAVLASLSRGAQRALLLAADHPQRLLAAAFVDPCFPASPFGGLRWRIMAHPRLRPALLIRPPVAAGWLKFNGAHWRADYIDFVRWFMHRVFNTPHSTKQIEDGIAWALETDAETLIASTLGRPRGAPATRPEADGVGTAGALSGACNFGARRQDHRPHTDAKALAKATGGELVKLAGGGHQPAGAQASGREPGAA